VQPQSSRFSSVAQPSIPRALTCQHRISRSRRMDPRSGPRPAAHPDQRPPAPSIRPVDEVGGGGERVAVDDAAGSEWLRMNWSIGSTGMTPRPVQRKACIERRQR